LPAAGTPSNAAITVGGDRYPPAMPARDTGAPSAVRIRAAEPADVAAITEITNALIGSTSYEWRDDPYALADRAEWLQRHVARGEPVLVAVDGDRVVGWTAYGDFRDTDRWPGYRFTVEHTIHVAESHWSGGVGRALLSRLCELAADAGKRVMVAGIDGTNEDSIRFHLRLGFVEVGRMPGVGDRSGRRLDLVLMQRELVPGER
jgi:phosphinothricin acetyltransferase